MALTPLVGRDEDLASVAAALSGWRVVTLTGVGGVGKTRLALQAASDVCASYPDGVWLCELATLSDPAEVDELVATVLGVQRRQGLSTRQRLVEFLRPQRALLVVDNCEHVLEAAAALIEAVTRGCPQVSVLATSREPLGIHGEYVRQVPPLALPSPSGDLHAERVASVELFRQRAEAAWPNFALTEDNLGAVAEICRRLDGLPLAIELAASRVRSMTPADIAARLDARFRLLRSGRRVAAARQRSLRSVIDWSYRLLSEAERHTFQRLSVFAGDFSLAAAEQVAAGPGVDEADVAEAVGGLVDKSMVNARVEDASMRYSLLETLRDYARERLDEHDASEAVRHRHADYYRSFAEQADVGLHGPDEAHWVKAVGSELDNLRAAHSWALASGHIDLAVRLAAALVWYAEWRMAAEMFVWAERAAQAAAAADSRSPLLAVVFASAAAGARNRGDLARAATLAQHGLDASQRTHDPLRRYPLTVLGHVAMFEGRLDQAARLFEEALKLSRDANDLPWASNTLAAQTLSHAYSGAVPLALRLAEETTRLADATANPTAMAGARYAAGEALMETDPDRAIGLLDASIRLARSVQNDFGVGVALVSAASLRGRRGRVEEALLLFGEVIDYWRRVGNWTQQWTTLRNVVELLTRLGAHEDAALLYGALTTADTAAPPFGADAQRLAAARHTLETQLGPETFKRAAAEGAKLHSDAAVALATAAIERTLSSPADAQP